MKPDPYQSENSNGKGYGSEELHIHDSHKSYCHKSYSRPDYYLKKISCSVAVKLDKEFDATIMMVLGYGWVAMTTLV